MTHRAVHDALLIAEHDGRAVPVPDGLLPVVTGRDRSSRTLIDI